MIKDKKQLEIKLSSLTPKTKRVIELEQYQSSGTLASLLLWPAYSNGDIFGKVVADFGCGNGIFGIGALMLGAKKVIFVDVDSSAIELCKENVSSLGFEDKSEFLNIDISKFSSKVDTVIMNPPFGVQTHKADKIFLEKGFNFSSSIYSIHKIESKNFIDTISSENGFKVKEVISVDLNILKSYSFHKLNSKSVAVGIWILKKI